MNPEKTASGVWQLIISLLAVIAVVGAIIIALDNRTSSVGGVTPTQSPESSVTPDLTATQNEQATQVTDATLIALKQIVATTAVFEQTVLPIPSPIPGPTGIYEDEQVQASGGKLGLSVQNTWFGIVDGSAVSVWAGALPDDLDQGVVHLILVLPYRTFEERLPTSERHGSLRIVAEQSNRLTLIATDSTTFYFDVPARQFVPSLTEVVPTATPPPTYTPYAPPQTAPPPTGYPLPTDMLSASTASP